MPRKRSTQSPEVTSARRKATYPGTRPERPSTVKAPNAGRSKDPRRKNGVAKSPGPLTSEKNPRRKFAATVGSPLILLRERKISNSKPSKRKKGEVPENEEAPRKVGKVYESQMSRLDSTEGTIY